MKKIIEQVNIYLKKFDPSYEVLAYAKLDNKYLFSYMSKVDDPNECIYTKKVKDNYYVPVIDNTIIEYDLEIHKIKDINISNNLDVINKLNFVYINDAKATYNNENL